MRNPGTRKKLKKPSFSMLLLGQRQSHMSDMTQITFVAPQQGIESNLFNSLESIESESERTVVMQPEELGINLENYDMLPVLTHNVNKRRRNYEKCLFIILIFFICSLVSLIVLFLVFFKDRIF